MSKVLLKNICKPNEIGKYGIPASAEDYDESKVRYLRISDIDDFGKLLDKDKKSVSATDINKYILEENDIVVARTGNSTGRTYFNEKKNGILAFAGFLIKYGLDNNKVNPKYLKYYTISSEYKQWVKNLSVGSTRGNINAQTFANCPILLPERKQQNFLVSILSLLDDKIELNNRINDNLEEMAKTLYDYWFVQFDFPNENGKPYKSSNGKMIWNEVLKKEIPQGWEIEKIESLGTITGGSTPSKAIAENFSFNGFPWITPKDLSQNTGNKFITKGEFDVTQKGLKEASLNILPANSVLMSSRAPIGYLAVNRFDCTTNQGFKSIVCNREYPYEYVFYVLKHNMPSIEANASGSTFKEISTAVLKSIKILKPQKEVVVKYQTIISTIFLKQDNLEIQNQQLSALRDWLLPMLMNGQVKAE